MSVSPVNSSAVLAIPTSFTVLHASFIFVLAFNVFSVYVILKHSPAQMKSYARYLLLFQIVSLITDIIAMWLVAPWFTLPVPGFVPTGPLVSIGISPGVQVILFYGVMICVAECMLELFFQRQQTIVPQTSFLKLNQWQITFYHGWVLIFIIGVMTSLSVMFEYNECDHEDYAKRFPMLKSLIRRQGFFCIGGEIVELIVLVLSFVELVITTTLFLLSGTSVYYLYKKDDRISQRTRDMQKTLMKILVVQTLVPFIFFYGPNIMMSSMVVNERTDLIAFNPWILFFFSLHGPSSTLLILVLYRPYFVYVRRLLCGLQGDSASVHSVPSVVLPRAATINAGSSMRSVQRSE